jgi:hypothetical protein
MLRELRTTPKFVALSNFTTFSLADVGDFEQYEHVNNTSELIVVCVAVFFAGCVGAEVFQGMRLDVESRLETEQHGDRYLFLDRCQVKK